MPVLQNILEGIPSGTTISPGNSGGASGNALDTVSIGASAVLAADNTHAAHGGLSLKCSTPAVATSSHTFWGTSLGAGQTQVWFRLYLFATAAPAANTRVMTMWNTTGGSSICGILLMNTAGKIIMQQSTSSTILTSAATFPLNQWFRVEGFVISSATVGQLEFKIFTTLDGTSPSETQTSTAVQNTGASVGSAGFGASNSVASAGPFWMDDFAVSTTGYLGPYAAPAPQGTSLKRAVVVPPPRRMRQTAVPARPVAVPDQNPPRVPARYPRPRMRAAQVPRVSLPALPPYGGVGPRAKALRIPPRRYRPAQVVPPQVVVPAPGIPQSPRRVLRLRPLAHHAPLPAPSASAPAPAAPRRRPVWVLRRPPRTMQPAPPPVSRPLAPAVVRPRRLWSLRWGRSAQLAPAQVIAPPPPQLAPGQSARSRVQVPRARRTVQPVPAQVTVTPPPGVPFRSPRWRWQFPLRHRPGQAAPRQFPPPAQPARRPLPVLRRLRPAPPVPAPPVVITPAAPSPAGASRRPVPLVPRKTRPAQVVPPQVAAPVQQFAVAARAKARSWVRRPRVAQPAPQRLPAPPAGTRTRARFIPLRRRLVVKVPPQVVVPPAIPAPQGQRARLRSWLKRLWRPALQLPPQVPPSIVIRIEAAGPPQRQWEGGPPAGQWDASEPVSRWEGGPPERQWSAGEPRTLWP